jgi:NDP-sugar pyrophosphorylase family protein
MYKHPPIPPIEIEYVLKLIEREAYLLFTRRGFQHGQDREDRLWAIKEVIPHVIRERVYALRISEFWLPMGQLRTFEELQKQAEHELLDAYAYWRWQKRGSPLDGSGDRDWREAECDLLGRCPPDDFWGNGAGNPAIGVLAGAA